MLHAEDGGHVAYVASVGAGKTRILCQAAIKLAIRYPGIRGLLGRFYSTELRDTTQKTFFELIGDIEQAIQDATGGPKPTFGAFHGQRNEWTAPNGSLIMFRPLEKAERKVKSLEIGFYGIDEASEVMKDDVEMLAARLRQKGYPHVGMMTSNPTSRRHWLYQWFVEKPLPTYKLFRTNSLENTHLPVNYLKDLRAKYTPDKIRRYLDGEWGELQEGRRPVFPTFTAEKHVGATRYEAGRPLYIGVDFGWACPGVVWAQMDATGRLLVLRSWLPRELTTHQLASGLKARTQEWFPHARTAVFGGHDASQRRAEGPQTNAEIFALHGLPISPRFTIRDRGLEIIRDLLEVRDNGTARILLDPSNDVLISAFEGGYYYPPLTTEDAPDVHQQKPEPVKDGIHDQAVDALRYIAVNVLDLKGEATTPMPWHAFRRPKGREEDRDTERRRPYRAVAGRY